MKITDLIAKLQALYFKHGEMEAWIYGDTEYGPVVGVELSNKRLLSLTEESSAVAVIE